MKEFIKYHGHTVVEDWRRVVNLVSAADQSHMFSTPKPLRVLTDSKSIAYEPLPPGRMLVTVLLRTLLPGTGRRRTANDAVIRSGAALASLHQIKQPTNELRTKAVWLSERIVGPGAVTAAKQVLTASPIAIYHGDFSHGNVWVSEDDKIWLYDPIPGPFSLDPNAVTASVYFDIGHMVACLWAVYPLRVYPFLWALDCANWVELFLAGYERQTGAPLDHETVNLVASETLLGFANYVSQHFYSPKAQIFSYLIRRKSRRLIRTLKRPA
jgi:hypothetical protein